MEVQAMTDTVQSFSAALRTALGDRIAVDASSFLEMFAEDGVMEYPFAPAGMTTRVEGRNALAAHLKELSKSIAFDHIGTITVHPMSDPDAVVLEFEGFGRGVITGEPYEQRYVSIVRMRNGRIVHYRDYWNPLVILRATKGSAAVETLTGGQTHLS